MTTSPTELNGPLNGGLEILPAGIAQRCPQVAGKPEFYAFGIGALRGGFKITLQGLQLFIHGQVLLSS